jgi:hypothetical protein
MLSIWKSLGNVIVLAICVVLFTLFYSLSDLTKKTDIKIMKRTPSAENILKVGPIGIIPLTKLPKIKSVRRIKSAPDLSIQSVMHPTRLQTTFSLIQDLITNIEISTKLHHDPNVAIGEIVLVILSSNPKDVNTKLLLLLFTCFISQNIHT